MNARRIGPTRLALEIVLVLAFLLTLTAGGLIVQARSGMSTSNLTPSGAPAAEIQVDANTAAALMSAEMAALTPPFYMTSIPLVQR
jgi:hypothetical protein